MHQPAVVFVAFLKRNLFRHKKDQSKAYDGLQHSKPMNFAENRILKGECQTAAVNHITIAEGISCTQTR